MFDPKLNRRIILLLVLTLLFIDTVYQTKQIISLSFGIIIITTFLVYIFILGWLVIYRFYPQAIRNLWFHYLAFIGSITMGMWGVFILLSFPLLLFKMLFLVTNKFYTLPFMSWRMLNIIILSISIIICFLGFLITLHGPNIKKLPLIH